MEVDKEKSKNPLRNKKCTKCLVHKKSSEFYKQPNGKPESLCKECKKTQRRKRYVLEKKQEELSRLVLFVDVMLEFEIKEMKARNKQADFILSKYKQAQAA